jgi:hypothetical protein
MSPTLKNLQGASGYTAAIVALIFVSGCLRSDPAVGSCDDLLRGDRGDREREVHQQFNTYPLETRYRLYICGSQAAHAPWGLEVPFAEGGEEAARFLSTKLEETTYDPTILDIVVVFAMMQTMQTFDATTDPHLMQTIEERITLLDGPLRESAELYLQTIRQGPGAPLPG